MFIIKMQDIDNVKPYLDPKLVRALEFLQNVDLQKLTPGEITIDSRELFARVGGYITEDFAEKNPEKHFDYIDVQCMVAGTESIGVGSVDPTMDIIINKKSEDDIVFYNHCTDEQFYTLQAGEMMVLFPWEVHRPGCIVADKAAEVVKKVVVKVKI